MPRLDYVNCADCGRNTEAVGPLSHTRLCEDCGTKRLAENVIGLHTMTGPAVLRWRRGMVACAGGVLLDDMASSP